MCSRERLLALLLCVVTAVALVMPGVSGQTTIANNAADMSGHIVMVADSATPRTVTNLFTFNRTGTNAPFAVGNAGAATVTNLSADQVDGLDSTRFIWARVTSTATGTQNDFAPGLTSGQNTLILENNATATTITGIAGGVEGQHVGFVQVGAGQTDFSNQNASSAAANRLTNYVTSGVTSIAPPGAGSQGGYIEYVYESVNARWRLVNHEQGAWITRTFGAGNYTASTGTWTVASATTDVYWLKGRTLSYAFNVSGTTSGTPITVKITFPASFTAASITPNAYYIANNGSGASEAGYLQSGGAGVATVGMQRLANVVFAAGTVSVLGQIACEVQ